MLVHRDNVEAERLGVLQLVEVAVVEPPALFRVEVAVGERYVDRAVLAAGLEIEVGVRHQVEHGYLHRSSTNLSGASACGRWPTCSMTCTAARGKRRLSSSQICTGRMRSSRPQMIFTGMSMRCSHFGRCGSCSRGSHARRAVVWRVLWPVSIPPGGSCPPPARLPH